jgi:DNA-directed RNA polymerase specialized sigma24 family protein
VDLMRSGRADPWPGCTAFEEGVAVIGGPGIDPADEAESLRMLEVALEKVPVSRRPAVRLHLDGHHLSDIARLLGWTPASARNRLYRGLDDLRSALRDDDAADNGT